MAAKPMSAGKRLYTADDLFAMDEDERVELVRGELRVMEPEPGPAHGLITARLGALLLQHVEARGLGAVFAPTSFQLARDPDTVRGPDVAFVRAEHVPAEGFGPRYADVAPDLAVEVLSPSNRAGDVREKVDDYFAAGVRAVWLVDPEHRTVTVLQPGRSARVVTERETLDGGHVVPGFRCAVSALFAHVRRHG